MMHDITENQLQDISEWIVSQTGLHFPRKKWHTLKKAALNASAACGMNASAFIAELLPPSPEKKRLDALVMHLTIGETYFLRDKHVFQILKDHIFRELVAQRSRNNQRINILSAGCASGEEPYSIAMLIDQTFPEIRDNDIFILGTDINLLFLEKAAKGVYSQWSLRETPEPIIRQYFKPIGGGLYAIAEHIRDRVRFCSLNLMENDYAARPEFREPFHIIFCRNVLMYFDDQNRKDVIGRMTGLLAENGWLITGPAETGFIQSPDLAPVRFANTMLHQKQATARFEKYQYPRFLQARAMPENKTSPPAPATRATRPKAAIPPLPIKDADPDFSAYEKAVDFYERGDYASATACLETMLPQINVGAAGFLMASEAMILLAKAHANLGRINAALKWCDRAIASEKLNPEFHYLRATILQSAGDVPAALQSLKQVLFLDPDFIMAHFMAGLLTKFPAGEKSLQNALDLLRSVDPEDVLPFSEGMTAARLSETIMEMIRKQGRA